MFHEALADLERPSLTEVGYCTKKAFLSNYSITEWFDLACQSAFNPGWNKLLIRLETSQKQAANKALPQKWEVLPTPSKLANLAIIALCLCYKPYGAILNVNMEIDKLAKLS